MAGLVRMFQGRGSCLLRQTSALVSRRSTMSTKKISVYEEMNQFWAKNKQLKRPLSPHLTIYGYHLTMVVSISNRIMAVAIQSALVGGSIALMCLPMDYTSVLTSLKSQNLGAGVIIGLKYLIAAPFIFHTLTGIRHFVWDTGVGYRNVTVRQVSYAVLLATALLSSALVFGIKPSAM